MTCEPVDAASGAFQIVHLYTPECKQDFLWSMESEHLEYHCCARDSVNLPECWADRASCAVSGCPQTFGPVCNAFVSIAPEEVLASTEGGGSNSEEWEYWRTVRQSCPHTPHSPLFASVHGSGRTRFFCSFLHKWQKTVTPWFLSYFVEVE